MTSEKKVWRRKYSAAMKAQVVAARGEPGASGAKEAMAHGINANVVHRWRQLACEGIGLNCRSSGVKVTWPYAMSDCEPQASMP